MEKRIILVQEFNQFPFRKKIIKIKVNYRNKMFPYSSYFKIKTNKFWKPF